MSDCLFCEIDKTRIISENDLAYAIRDGFPVTEYHTLIIPKRHAETYFDMTSDEKRACDELLHLIKNEILSDDEGVTGFNIGMNAGASAGQTIFHSHIHLIPRRDGDVEQPRGGVRGVIPNKQKY
ncbi:MAG: HIT family protein [Burkholderiales bacterium]|nr:HIT family protein [Burkholderiales bacterium]